MEEYSNTIVYHQGMQRARHAFDDGYRLLGSERFFRTSRA